MCINFYPGKIPVFESIFGTVKCETGYHDTLKTKLWTYKEAEQNILFYIEYYNNKRIQKN